MTEHELADMIEHHIATYPAPAPVVGLLAEQWQQIIAALRKSSTMGEIVKTLNSAAAYLAAHDKPTLASDCRVCAKVVEDLLLSEGHHE